MPRSTASLVGRGDQLRALLQLLERLSASQAVGAVVGGDAGVGKTRLLSELRARAESAEVTVLVGHCMDLGDAPPPYLAFTEMFGQLAAHRPELFARALSDYPALARLLPESVAQAPLERAQRGELFESVLGVLGVVADAGPLLVVVEDMHWADRATRDLLEFLFTRLDDQRLGIVVSYRNDDLHRRHPLRPVLAHWLRLPAVTNIELERLSPAEVRELVRQLHPEPLAADVLTSITNRAEGNAFFTEELVAVADQGDPAHLPWRLADLLLVRLDQLSEDAREIVRVAAVAGRSVPHDMLADVVRLSGAQLDAALREAIDAYVLQPTESGYTFRHALLAEAGYDELLPGERVRLHAAYVRVLAPLGDRSRAELARHALASHDLQTAFTANVRAGDEAMAVAAPQEALTHFEAALEIRPRLAEAVEDGASLVLAAVDAALAAGDAHRGLRLARAAVGELPADAPDVERARLLYALGRAAVEAEADAEAMTAVTEATRLTRDETSELRVRVAALFARLTMFAGRDVDAQRWARDAVDLADRIEQPAAAVEARNTLALLLRRVSDPLEVATRLRELAADARRDGEPATEIRTLHNLGGLLFEQGLLAQAEQAYDETWRRARDLGRPWTLYGVDARAMVAHVRHQLGDWDGALAVADLGDEQATPLATERLRGVALFVRIGRGEATALAQAQAQRPAWPTDSAIANTSILVMLEGYAAAGDTRRAFALVDEAYEVLGRVWQEEWFLGRIRIATLGIMAAATAARDAPAAERSALAKHAGELARDGRLAVQRGQPRGRSLGVEAVAWTKRLEAEWARLRWIADIDPPSAVELVAAWDAALAAFGYGNQYEATRCRVALVGILRTLGASAGSPGQADEQLAQAGADARAMGAAPLLAELGGRHSATGTADATGHLAALTEREREVLALLIDARTNRQIAQRLYISEKTVSVHVSNILAKLAVRSRAEAAAFARTHGFDAR